MKPAEKILIIGATSVLAQAAARIFAAEGASFVLVARNKAKLDVVVKDLLTRGAAGAVPVVLDVNDTARYGAVLKEAFAALGGFDVVLMAHGSSADQRACEQDEALLLREIHTNFTSAVLLLMRIAAILEAQKKGVMAVIASVSGDRGRRSQYVYGAGKGGLAVLLQGLRQRLYPAGVAVVTVKAGLARTPMTAQVDARRMRWLAVGPEVIGRGIHTAIRQRKEVVYVPWFWGLLMCVIRMVPERFFKRIGF